MTAIAKQLGLAQTLSISRIITKLREFHETTHQAGEAINAAINPEVSALPKSRSEEIDNETSEPISVISE
jgi:hypothetical protein